MRPEATDTEQAKRGRNMVPFHGKLAETWFHSVEKWARHGSIPWKSPGSVAGSLRVAPHRLFLARGGGGRGGRAGREEGGGRRGGRAKKISPARGGGGGNCGKATGKAGKTGAKKFFEKELTRGEGAGIVPPRSPARPPHLVERGAAAGADGAARCGPRRSLKSEERSCNAASKQERQGKYKQLVFSQRSIL